MRNSRLSDYLKDHYSDWPGKFEGKWTARIRPEVIALEKLLRRELWAPTYILGALNIDNGRQKGLDLDRLPNIGYLMLEYLFEGNRSLVDMFKEQPYDEDENASQVLRTAEEFGFKSNDATIRDLEVAFHWQEPFLWKVHNGARVRSQRQGHQPSSLAESRKMHDGKSEDIDSIQLSWNKRSQLRTWLQEHGDHKVVVSTYVRPRLEDLNETYEATLPLTGSSRVLFSTKEGFTGIGPAGLEQGDEIVVPFGSSRPWVLRNHGDHHVLIGDAIVPGIMSGRLETLYEDGLVSAADYALL
jgi:hypothetical protein